MPTFTLGGKTLATQTGTNEPVLGSNVLFNPSRHILKIEQTVKRNRWEGAGNTNEQLITDLNCSITPDFANSKILVSYNFDTSAGATLTAFAYMERDIAGAGWAKLSAMMGESNGVNNSEAISHAGIYANWMLNNHSRMFLDTPSYTLGQTISYRIGCRTENTSYPIYVGSTQRDSTQFHPRTSSIITLMEVAE